MMVIFTDEMIHPRNRIDKVYICAREGLANKSLRPHNSWCDHRGKKDQTSNLWDSKGGSPEKNKSIVQLTIHERT